MNSLHSHFSSYWCCTIRGIPRVEREVLNTLIILVAWEILKHRNAFVFDGDWPNIEVLLHWVANEGALWCLAEASALHRLLARSLVVDH